jgi:hydrogenase maturation protease
MVVPALAHLTVIGCGNPNRSDDGVGVYVAQALLARLRAAPHDGVRVFDAGTNGMEVMFQARGATRLVVVDASRSGAPPGAVFELPGSEVADEPHAGFNLHDFRWEHAVAAGRRIFRDAFPAEVRVVLVEAQSLDFGLALSEPVRRAADGVIERLWAEIDGG